VGSVLGVGAGSVYQRAVEPVYHAAVVRFEKDGAFLELELDGAELVVRRGAPGEPPVEERRTHEGPARARWEYDRRVALAIADGQRRVVAEPEPGELTSPLLDAIRAAPEETEAYLVYADWLQRRGDPRGELICVQHAIAEQHRLGRTQEEKYFSERAVALDRAELLLLLLHRERFFGPVLSRVHSVEQQRYLSDLFELTWHLGFIRAASQPRSLRRQGLDRELWRALLQTSSAALIREIRLDWADADQLVAEAPLLTLERLALVLESWWPPEREEETLDADLGYRSLDEVLGPPADHIDGALQRLRPLLLSEVAPRLTELVLQRNPFGAHLLRFVLGLPLCSRLRLLDLSHGTLADADLPLLLEHVPALASLEQLDLRRNRFGKKGRSRLRAMGPHVQVE